MSSRPLAVVAVATGLVYVLTLVVTPFVDPAMDVLDAHPEDYARGPARPFVLGGYLAVAAMAVAIAALLRTRTRRGRLAALLLLGGAVVALAVAIDQTPVTGGLLLAGVIGLAVAPLIQQSAPGTRAPVRVTAVAVALCFLVLVFAPTGMDGIANRVFDVALGAWGVAYGLSALGAPPARDPAAPA